MIEATVIIVGGGPAGSTCAWELKKRGIDALVLDKRTFPRTKLCAGWITPKVMADLELSPGAYPHRLLTYNRIRFYFKGVPVPVPTRQFSIRRHEFDQYLLDRAGADVRHHHVKNICETNGCFVIDDTFRCTWLVGAGGTHCPVYKRFFTERHPRDPRNCIATVEEEFPYSWQDPRCRLWFFEKGLPGYAWYVPKQHGYLNVGIGGKLASLKKRGRTINDHWRVFAGKLADEGLAAGHEFTPRGHLYYLRGGSDNAQRGKVLIAGDAAGLATKDMGEGIGPAVESGKLAAEAIATGRRYSLAAVTRWSAPQILIPSPGRASS